jgi:hypothetical protein
MFEHVTKKVGSGWRGMSVRVNLTVAPLFEPACGSCGAKDRLGCQRSGSDR